MNIKTIGKYQLSKKLGSGSFGEIYQCRFGLIISLQNQKFLNFLGTSTQTHEELAIKLVKIHIIKNDKFVL